MHELSITEHLLEDCLREAKRQNASRPRAQGSNPRPFPSKSIAWTAAGTARSPRIIWNAPTAAACG